MGDKATLSLDGKSFDFDISSLRSETSYITKDTGFSNTGSFFSSITYVDRTNGILQYRGYPIEDSNSHF